MSTRIEKRINSSTHVLLDQNGLGKEPPIVTFASNGQMDSITGTQVAIFRGAQSEIRQLLGIQHIHNIPELKRNRRAYNGAVDHTYRLIAGNYDIDETKVREVVDGYGELADSVIDYATRDLPPEFSEYGRTSSIKDINNPVDLIIAMFDNDLSPTDRFRAKRKLLLMKTIASHYQEEQLGRTEKAHKQLRNFFEDEINPVLDPVSPTDNLRRYILSTHEPETFSTVDTKVIADEEKASLDLQSGQKLTPVIQRTFTVATRDGERKVNIYIPEGSIPGMPRRKSREAMILKQLRSGNDNPALAVDDQVGFMGIFDNPSDLHLFIDHLAGHASKRGLLLSLEKVEDTLEGGEHQPRSAGSSRDLRRFKSILHMDGMRPEFIGHTLSTMTDYRYKDGLGHREYTNTRLFKDGVVELLFPQDLYEYEPTQVEKYAADKVRAEARRPE